MIVMPQPYSTAPLSPQIQKLQRALLTADESLDTARALEIARELCEGGWHDGQIAGGIPADTLDLSTRFLLRFAFTGETASPFEEAAGIATQFSQHGANVLGLYARPDHVAVEILTTVEQALRILASMDEVPLTILADWLASAGYSGDLERYVDQFAKQVFGPTPTRTAPKPLPPLVLASAPLHLH